MTNLQLRRFYDGLQSVGRLSGVKFAYAVAKNTRKVEACLKDLEKASAPAPEMLEFEKTRIALCEEHAKKGEDGKPLTEAAGPNATRYIMEDREAFDAALEKLQDENQATLEAQEELNKQIEELGEEESSFKVYTVKLSLVPTDISASQLESILEMIEDDEE